MNIYKILLLLPILSINFVQAMETSVKSLQIIDQHKQDDLAAPQNLVSAHTDDITAMCMDNAGEILFTGSRDNTIKIWRSRLYKKTKCLKDLAAYFSQNPASFLRLLPLDILKEVVYFNFNAKDLEAYECIATLKGHEDPIFYLYISSDDLLISGSFTRVKVWKKKDPQDPSSYEYVSRVQKGIHFVHRPLHTDQAGRLFCEDIEDSKVINIFEKDPIDPKIYRHIKQLKGHGNQIFSIWVDSRGVLFSADETVVKIWQMTVPGDATTYTCICTLDCHDPLEETVRVALCIDSAERLFVGNIRRIQIWEQAKPNDPKTYTCINQIDNADGRHMWLDADDQLFCTSSCLSMEVYKKTNPGDAKTYKLAAVHCLFPNNANACTKICGNANGLIFVNSLAVPLIMGKLTTPDDPTSYTGIATYANNNHPKDSILLTGASATRQALISQLPVMQTGIPRQQLKQAASAFRKGAIEARLKLRKRTETPALAIAQEHQAKDKEDAEMAAATNESLKPSTENPKTTTTSKDVEKEDLESLKKPDESQKK